MSPRHTVHVVHPFLTVPLVTVVLRGARLDVRAVHAVVVGLAGEGLRPRVGDDGAGLASGGETDGEKCGATARAAPAVILRAMAFI
jgi:hypothetical protein